MKSVSVKLKQNVRYNAHHIGNAQNSAIRNILSRLGDESFSEKDWIETKKYFGGKCAYCGIKDGKMVCDHAIPINLEKLGEHKLGNMVLSCARCNSKKNKQDYIEFCGENKIAAEKISEYMSSRNYIPLTEDTEKSDNIRLILRKMHEEIRVVTEEYVKLINASFFV